MKDLIKKLVETTGPSGYEDQIRAVIQKEITPFCDSVQVDALGNLVARKFKGSAAGKRIMLAAHIDEIGIIATHVDENGFIRFTNIGGVRPINCIGGRVRFLNGLNGVIGLEKLENPEKIPSLENMFIDVGAETKADCAIKVGDVAAFDRPFFTIENRLVSKAMDDRIGAAVMIEVMKQLQNSPHELVFVFSVQEEVGLRGATTAAYHIDPAIGLSVDVTLCGDTPKGIKMAVGLGKGAAIKVRDGGMLSDPRLVGLLQKCAEENKIPVQLEVLEAGTTDAKAIQLSRAGVPAGCISIPCRYVHSPSEMTDYRDVKSAVDLICAFVSHPIELEWKRLYPDSLRYAG